MSQDTLNRSMRDTTSLDKIESEIYKGVPIEEGPSIVYGDVLHTVTLAEFEAISGKKFIWPEYEEEDE